jgi:hypothetical protein
MKLKHSLILLAALTTISCAHDPMRFTKPLDATPQDYEAARQACGGDKKGGGYFLFGPLILLAPVVLAVEAVKASNRSNVQTCMEAKGFKCIENCSN